MTIEIIAVLKSGTGVLYQVPGQPDPDQYHYGRVVEITPGRKIIETTHGLTKKKQPSHRANGARAESTNNLTSDRTK